MTAPPVPATPAELAQALASTGYLADEGLATAGYLALRLGRPLFLEGDVGVRRGGQARRRWLPRTDRETRRRAVST